MFGGMEGARRVVLTPWQEELTARLMGHTEPKLAGGLKMKAFYESAYGDDVVTHHINHHVSEAIRREKANEENENVRKKRAEWVRLKQLEDPQLSMYFRDELIARNKLVINKLCWDRRARKSVGPVLRDFNRNSRRKFHFPKNINEDPMAILSERHCTDGQALLRRFSKGNAGKHP
eukprot:jgi/Undpi1/11401/HiC_scaffold_30.g13698.m1